MTMVFDCLSAVKIVLNIALLQGISFKPPIKTIKKYVTLEHNPNTFCIVETVLLISSGWVKSLCKTSHSNVPWRFDVVTS